MQYLTENDIKHAAVSFLKSHYKHRSRLGETTTQTDMVTPAGTIADGHITYRTGFENDFLATIEATSYARADEVKYKKRNAHLNWDALTFGSIVTLFIFLFIYINKYFTIEHEGVPIAIISTLSSILFFSLLYRLIFGNIKNYRQIYALEQFKTYAADEQWVAVGIDVFENPDDKYLTELKRQCINNGFGLMIVEKDLEIRQSITPAKLPMDGKKRKKQEFLTTGENTTSNSDITNRIFNLVGWEKEKRFRYDYKIQLLLIFLCWSIFFALLWKEWNKRNEIYVNNKKYRKELLKKKKELERESNFFIIDSGYVVAYDGTIREYDLGELQFYDQNEIRNWYDKNHQDSLWTLLNDRDHNNHQIILDSINKLLEKDKSIQPVTASIKKKKPAVKKKKPNSYSVCKEYYAWKDTKFILKDGMYKSLKNAEYRVEQINLAGVVGGILRGGCFKDTKGYYMVYVDVIYTDLTKAESNLPYFNQLLKDKGYSSGELELKKLSVRK